MSYAKKNFQGVDVREGIVGAILIKVKDPVFESQTKNKLSNNEIRAPIVQEVKDAVQNLLYKFPEDGKQDYRADLCLMKSCGKSSPRLKKRRKKNRKKSHSKSQNCAIPNSISAMGQKKGEESMIFLTEGESASASIVMTRDPLTQAVFSLRGKPLNVHGMKLDQLYKNEEMYNLMSALNIEEDLTNLRYQQSDPCHRCRCRRDAYPQSSDHFLFSPILKGLS